MIKRLKMAFFILTILFGAFLFAYGGYDDSPGAQGLGVLLTVSGIIGVIRINKNDA